MYHDIIEKQLMFPYYLNPLAVDLLQCLLAKDQLHRYTFTNIKDIKSHPWCHDIDWERMS
jgi:hypothetical protein